MTESTTPKKSSKARKAAPGEFIRREHPSVHTTFVAFDKKFREASPAVQRWMLACLDSQIKTIELIVSGPDKYAQKTAAFDEEKFRLDYPDLYKALVGLQQSTKRLNDTLARAKASRQNT